MPWSPNVEDEISASKRIKQRLAEEGAQILGTLQGSEYTIYEYEYRPDALAPLDLGSVAVEKIYSYPKSSETFKGHLSPTLFA